MSNKKCRHCGKEIPSDSRFCNYCGGDNREVKKEEESDELNILSQFGYIGSIAPSSKKEEKKSSVSQEKPSKEQPEVNIVKNIVNEKEKEPSKIEETPIAKEAPVKEQAPRVEEKQEDVSRTEIKKETIKKEESVSDKEYKPKQKEVKAPFDPNRNIKRNVNMIEEQDFSDDTSYHIPEGFSIFDRADDDDFYIEDEEEFEGAFEKSFSIASKSEERPNFKTGEKKEFSEKDESTKDSFDTSIDSEEPSSNRFFQDSHSGYADEIADNQKRKEAIVEESENEKEEALEGRIAQRNKGAKRRRSARKDILNKKIYDIEQDMSAIDESDLDYDGYYENVIPIDFGQNKKKMDPRILILVFSIIALIAIATTIIWWVLK